MNPADFEVEDSLCGRLVAKYCRSFSVVKGGRVCSGNLYMFVLLLCIGCACSVYDVHTSRCTVVDDDDDDDSVWRDWECFTPLVPAEAVFFFFLNILHLWA